MPELPEVECITQVCRLLEGRRIHSVDLLSPKIRYFLDLQMIQAEGQLIREVFRRGKYMIWNLDHGALIFHFGMSGSLAFRQIKKIHDHLHFSVEEHIIYYHDPRRFGMVWYVTHHEDFFDKKALGLDPFDNACTAEWLFEQAKNRKLSIKQFLFDQSIIAGLGNIYINEALFLAHIHRS